MPLCTLCGNILKHKPGVQSLVFQCSICNQDFKGSERDTLVFNEESNSKYTMKKNGRNIFHYPSNHKVFKDCPSCDAKIVAWENDKDLNKIYGCDCGYSWKEVISSGGS